MKYDFRLIQLLLDLEDAVHLVRVLVGLDVGLQRGEGDRFPRGTSVRVEGEEFVKSLGKDLVSGERRVLVITDDDTGDTLGARVYVECEVCGLAVRG